MFITLEGPDGSGKSTVLERVAPLLEAEGHALVLTREPGGTSLGEKIRALLLDPGETMDPRTEALLYAASRTEHLSRVILPALEEGKWVLCDRFLLSSLAYQGHGRGLGEEAVEKVNHWALEVKPDAVLFFHIDPETTLARRGIEERDRLELSGKDFHRRVFEGYLDYGRRHGTDPNFYVIDATQDVETVTREVLACIHRAERRKG